jgi:CRISPR-associated protein Cmr1
MDFRIKAQTEIWTGGSNRHNTYLQLTGLLGGIRWWAEALARSYGVRACDPTDENQRCKKAGLCPICELFGNVAVPQAAKFALRCWNDADGLPDKKEARTDPLIRSTTPSDLVFHLEFLFYRSPKPYERCLLAKTIDLISQYGSLGGKTTLKPSKTSTKQQHRDYGIIRLLGVTGLGPEDRKSWEEETSKGAGAGGSQPDLPNLDLFWFLPGETVIGDSSQRDDAFNHLLGLSRTNWPGRTPASVPFRDGYDDVRESVCGIYKKRSKRVFSFKKPARTWGYVLDSTLWAKVPGWLQAAGADPSKIVYGKDVKSKDIESALAKPASTS